MKNKILALLGVIFLSLSLTSCIGASNKQVITVWVAENAVDFTREQCRAFLAQNPDVDERFTITVVAMGEGETATQLLTDVEAGADVYSFAQDQLGRLVRAGALSPLGGAFEEKVKEENVQSSVEAATMNNTVYAYPLTADNGYMLYYDASVIKDAGSLSSILSACSAHDKSFYMDIRNGWYLVSFFFGAGCSYQTTVSEDGKIVAVDCDFNSQNGLAALKQMIALAKNQAFQQSTDVASQFDPVAGKAAAAVSGPWDAATVQRQLGDRYGVTVLPQMDLAGNAGQMSTWAGFKLMGVNPTQGEEAVRASHRLASYLTGETAQLERFQHVGWGPSNEAAQQSPEVAQDLALRALSEQMASSPAQPQCSSNFWKKLEALGTEVDTGTYDAYTDAQLQVVLDELTEYLKNDVER